MKSFVPAILVLVLAWALASGRRGASLALETRGYQQNEKQVSGSGDWHSRPALAGVFLDQDFSAVTRTLGNGELIYTSPEYIKQREQRYKWKTSSASVEVGFNQQKKAVFVGLSSEKRVRSIGGVYLNWDTISSVQKKLGRPNRTEGPDLNETTAFYSLVYLAGPQRTQEVHFVSFIDWDRLHLDPKSISPMNFAKRQIVKAFVKKHRENP